MDVSTVRLSRRSVGVAVMLCGAALTLGSTGLADQKLSPSGAGNTHEGKIEMPLVRGAAMQPEVTVVSLPGNCGRHIDMTLQWSEEDDWVKVKLKGKGVLERHPTVTRTAGVNFFPNPFWPEAQSFTNGRYQFWFISPAGDMTFYYDPVSLDLLGSQYELAPPPPGAIPVTVPSVKVVGSPFFQPAANGDVDVELEWKYSAMLRGDRPDLAHHPTSFPPTNLCESNPFRYDLSTTRGFLSNARPAAEALPFSAYLRNGMFFQITIEPPTYFVDPPLDTQTSTYSNASLFGGGIPPGYTWDIHGAFMNVAPGIRPFGGAGSCADFFTGVHTQNMNFCGP